MASLALFALAVFAVAASANDAAMPERREMFEFENVIASPPPSPVDCVWGAWGDWSDCSNECGYGTRQRFREKTVFEHLGGTCAETVDDCSSSSLIRALGEACTSRDVEQCNGGSLVSGWVDGAKNEPAAPFPSCGDGSDSCTGYRPCPVDCVWSSWSRWTDCNAQCGQNGVQQRIRSVFTEPWPSVYFEGSTSKDCELNVLDITTDGTLYEGDADSRITYPCGIPCSGENHEERPCFRMECPIDCEWGEWSSWSTCSKNSGKGSQFRTRNVKVQEQHGGKACKPTACESSNKGQCGRREIRHCNTMDYEPYQALRIADDDPSTVANAMVQDLAKKEALCAAQDGADDTNCHMLQERSGGPLTAVGANPRPNDPQGVSCMDKEGGCTDDDLIPTGAIGVTEEVA